MTEWCHLSVYRVMTSADRTTPNSERNAHLVAYKSMRSILPAELCDLVGEKLIELLNSDRLPAVLDFRLRPQDDLTKCTYAHLLSHQEGRRAFPLVLVYDVCNRGSFNFIRQAYEAILRSWPPDMLHLQARFPAVVLAVSHTWDFMRQVSRQEGLEFAMAIERPYYEIELGGRRDCKETLGAIATAFYLFIKVPPDLWAETHRALCSASYLQAQ